MTTGRFSGKDHSSDEQGEEFSPSVSASPEPYEADVIVSLQMEAPAKTAALSREKSDAAASPQSKPKESSRGTPECSFLDCHCSLELSVPKFTCPACAGTFCPSHAGKSNYELQIDGTGRFDPLNGIWQRVCQQCYLNRPGYLPFF